jgi:hypothetical protein
LPPVTVLGDIERDATPSGALTVSVADALELPKLPVMVAWVVVEGGLVVTGNVADICPPGTVTLAPT